MATSSSPKGSLLSLLSMVRVTWGVTLGFSRWSAVENNILHSGAAQGFAGLLSQNPADGVADIALSAAVRSYHGGDSWSKGKLSRSGKVLKPCSFSDFNSTISPALNFYFSRRNRRVWHRRASIPSSLSFCMFSRFVPQSGKAPLGCPKFQWQTAFCPIAQTRAKMSL